MAGRALCYSDLPWRICRGPARSVLGREPAAALEPAMLSHGSTQLTGGHGGGLGTCHFCPARDSSNRRSSLQGSLLGQDLVRSALPFEAVAIQACFLPVSFTGISSALCTAPLPNTHTLALLTPSRPLLPGRLSWSAPWSPNSLQTPGSAHTSEDGRVGSWGVRHTAVPENVRGES